MASVFQRVVFAQVWISMINTFFTWLYLDIVLSLFGVDLPLVKTLVALTFIVGLLPIIGNLISNTAIVIVCLSQGVPVAVASLVFLVVIHKLEYFLNARIIGSHINARAWELLIAMLVMEAAFGIPGLIAAPIFYAYFKEELRDKAPHLTPSPRRCSSSVACSNFCMRSTSSILKMLEASLLMMLKDGFAAALVPGGDVHELAFKVLDTPQPHAKVGCGTVGGVDQVCIVVEVALVLELRVDTASGAGLPLTLICESTSISTVTLPFSSGQASIFDFIFTLPLTPSSFTSNSIDWVIEPSFANCNSQEPLS